MSQRDDQIIPDSTYPQLEMPPEFRSQIPDHLLGEATPSERYIMEQTSIMRQAMDWSVKAHLSADKNLRRTNGRLIRAEDNIDAIKEDRKFWGRGWRFLVTVGGIIGGLISFFILVTRFLTGGG